MSNFEFLQQDWSSLYRKMQKAEERVNTEPVSTALSCRLVLEECIHKVYELEYIEKPFNKELINLMSSEEVKAIIPFQLIEGIHIVRKTGNNAAHYGRRVSNKDALISIKYLYSFLKWFAQTYSETVPEIPGSFNEGAIPKVGEQQRKLKELQSEQEKAQQELLERIKKLEEERESILERAKASEESLLEFKQKEEEAKKAIVQQRKERKAEVSLEYTEAETRKHIIDVDLKEAGWHELREGRELEYPVKGMPRTKDNPNGNGYVDYVLWDDKGKPIALIEAKRASKDLENGKHQAWLYANCLEGMHGQRPVIFYTNGYEIKLWDDTFYSTPRQVYGYYTKDELQWQIQKRKTLKDIRNASINYDIAGKGRPYQVQAIKSVCEDFVTDSSEGLKGNKRRALLVMATGSGKTRTAAALVDVLLKNNWVKRALFLADRNALVTQAQRNFGEYLPNVSSIDLTKEKENDTTRLVFSTYQTIMHRIDAVDESEGRFYGVGHFDLIIVDEAHRSIYNRYKAIFEYFDAMIVGLTATPKDGIDHNTFELFGCSNDDPTFMFPLEDAVPDFLCPYQNIDISTDFLREGIKYSQLSEKDKARYEDTFQDKTTGLFPDEIRANAMNKWLFNKDTVNKVLDEFMSKGLKIEGGDKIGRTIIFAVNQKHAKFIVDCFTERYPHYPSGFIAMIHNEVSHAQSLIDAFCDQHKENLPQIAVSVDMMDTGIDAPRVLNLVFFKVVRSYAKFWQMIGRGTRLCPDVYGPGQPKESFLIFDVCGNFDFFETKKKGAETKAIKPITQQIFESRVHLSRLLAETGEIEDLELSKDLRDLLHHAVEQLAKEKDRYQVRMKLKYVDEFSARERWNNISNDDVHILEEHISELPIPETINEMARRFDLLMLKLQIASLMMSGKTKQYEENLIQIAEGLSQKYTIPQVARSKGLIEGMRDPEFYKGISQKKLEEIREEIRELVQYLEVQGRETVYTDIKDSDIISTVREPDLNTSYGTIYKKRVEKYIREHKNHLTISKLNSNQAITKDEVSALEEILFDGTERGTREDFQKEYGGEPLGVFIRSIVGLDTKAAQVAFSEFIDAGNLSSAQMVFIQNIIDHLTINGTIDPAMLFEPPFTDLSQDGVYGLFDDGQAQRIVTIIEGINDNAVGA